MLSSRGRLRTCEAGGYGNSPYLPLDFAVSALTNNTEVSRGTSVPLLASHLPLGNRYEFLPPPERPLIPISRSRFPMSSSFPLRSTGFPDDRLPCGRSGPRHSLKPAKRAHHPAPNPTPASRSRSRTPSPSMLRGGGRGRYPARPRRPLSR